MSLGEMFVAEKPFQRLIHIGISCAMVGVSSSIITRRNEKSFRRFSCGLIARRRIESESNEHHDHARTGGATGFPVILPVNPSLFGEAGLHPAAFP
jgi:hypothetical protein